MAVKFNINSGFETHAVPAQRESDFILEAVDPVGRLNLLPLIVDWQKFAYEKYKKEDDQNVQSLFRDCERILDLITTKLDSEDIVDGEIFICKNTTQQEPQAIMAISDSSEMSLEIDDLVTNPKNIHSQNQLDPSRVRGAGSFLLSQAEKIARQRNKIAIRLTPIPSAIGFYIKHDFRIDPCTFIDEFCFDMIKILGQASG